MRSTKALRRFPVGQWVCKNFRLRKHPKILYVTPRGEYGKIAMTSTQRQQVKQVQKKKARQLNLLDRCMDVMGFEHAE